MNPTETEKESPSLASLLSRYNYITPSPEPKSAADHDAIATTFSEYQKQSRKTAMYPNAGKNFIYPTLGLSGEAGEVSEKIKKVLRDKGGIIDETTKQEIAKELGDVMWYLAQIASELGLSLEDIANGNLKKLFSRKDRGVLTGNGDNR
jgi:NTP pyrophosphatase (non-canonical NTP hydrolase)